MAGLVGFRQLGLSFLLAHLADASSGCYDKVSAPIIKNDKTNAKEGTFPLLVYSHGFGGNMDMGTYFLRQIASKGIVVAAVEHTDGTASSTVLKDGTILPFSPGMQSGREQLSQRSDEILEASVLSNLPPDFQSMIDTNRVFLGGHSYGAPSALLASARAKKNISGNLSINIAGLVLHDPALAMGYGMLTTEDLTAVPTISYTSDEYNRGGVKCGNLTLHVRGAFHGNFVDAPLWAPLWVMRLLSTVIPACGPADPMEVHEELAQSLSAFVETGRVDSASVMKGHLFEFIAR
uniref:1-alkyl-2-acetylglycerophosphocholine esterase n=1 Tax=Chaetoceros debilis TaxID=122233 RepID=A0A7S3Q643_9STRA